MTLENIILLFQDIATRHKQINGFVVSEDYNLGSIDDSDFPLLAIVPTNPNLPRDVNGFSMFTMDFEIKLLDLVNDDLDNKIHVYSDAIEILKDIVNEFNTHPYYHELGLDVISDASMEKLEEFTDTDLYGYGVELTLASPNKISYCGSPITDITGFNSGGGASDATVTNTSGSYSTLVSAGGTLVLPDITHIDSDGSNVVTPAQEVFTATSFVDVVVTDNLNGSSPIAVSSGGTYTCTAATVQSGIQYDRSGYNTLQTTSYATYDDGWQLANGGYDFTHPTNPETIQGIDYSTGDELTLLYNNAFGNKSRWTLEDGTAFNPDTPSTGAQENVNFIDNLNGLMIRVLGWVYEYDNTMGVGGELESHNAASLGGHNDWMIPSISMLQKYWSILLTEFSHRIGLPHFYQSTSRHVGSSTTSNASTSIYYMHGAIGSLYNWAKSNTNYKVLVRKHF